MLALRPSIRDGREAVYGIILFGTYAVVAAVSVLSLVSLGLGDKLAPGALMLCTVSALYVMAIGLLTHFYKRQAAAYLLVLFYLMLAAGIIWCWGVNTPIGLLVFSVVIVLAGMLLSAKYALLAALIAGLFLMAVQTAVVRGWHTPDMSWTGKDSTYSDVVASGIVFCLLALVSWLYNRQMERSLIRARLAELALLQQRATLRQKVEERTEQLRQAQLEEMQQMYRFAELGQLGVTLLHDLANHLTALTLEIEGLQSSQNSRALRRAHEITGYLEKVVDSTRTRLRGDTEKQTFDIVRKTTEVIEFLDYKASQVGVAINWRPPAKTWKCTGDPTSFSQVIAIIVSNGIDAYSNIIPNQSSRVAQRRLAVSMKRDATNIVIVISDWGGGISKSRRKLLFKPFCSTKKAGLGVGLFIARQTVVVNFGGDITLSPARDRTEFIIKLPIKT